MKQPTLQERVQAVTHAAMRAGVTRLPDGRLQGPRLSIYAYLEDMRRLGYDVLAPPAPPDPARAVAKAHRIAVERWRRARKAGKHG